MKIQVKWAAQGIWRQRIMLLALLLVFVSVMAAPVAADEPPAQPDSSNAVAAVTATGGIGPFRVMDMNPGTGPSNPDYMTVLNGGLY